MSTSVKFLFYKWSHYIALMNKFAKTLLPPDSLDVDAAYQDFCNTIKKAAKKTIPRGYGNNYIPCWDAECESLYKTFLQSPQGDDSSLAATALLAKLDRKRRDRWSEAVRSIDFSHSSRKAWSILYNLTGRSRHSPRHCPVSANAIASQLVRNGKYEAVDFKSSRLVSQEVSDLWRATTPDAVNISDNFSQREFAAALQHLKPGKAPVLDSICSELIFHAGAALKSWLRDFLSSCLRRLNNSQDLEKSACGRDPKTSKARRGPKELSTDISAPIAFHLNNREAERELKVYSNGRFLPFCPTPTYLGVKLDRLLTFLHHLVALRKNLSSRVTLLRQLVGSGWGAGAISLRIATLSVVYSTAEYCAPVWCCSAHTRLIDSVLNDALRIVTGCLRPTPTDHLPVLSGIQPAELR